MKRFHLICVLCVLAACASTVRCRPDADVIPKKDVKFDYRDPFGAFARWYMGTVCKGNFL